MVQSAGGVEYTDSISTESKTPQRTNAEALENAEYPLIAIAPRSTLARSGSI